jgi:hypothetical protein
MEKSLLISLYILWHQSFNYLSLVQYFGYYTDNKGDEDPLVSPLYHT